MSSAKELPEEKRILIRNAVQRINDIANNLLENSKKNIDKQNELQNNNADFFESTPSNLQLSNHQLDTYLLSSLIDTIVSEKRIQYRDKPNINIAADLNQAYGLFVQIDSQKLQTVLSNLINNSVEALPEFKGEITVSIRGYTNTILIVVFDNGIGIPSNILSNIGKLGFSYGKKGTESGSGMGIAHAKNTIESFGGKFEIQSRSGDGTMINITLKREKTPPWFVEEIQLSSTTYIVIIDDDFSIHQVWIGRLKSLNILDFTQYSSFTSIKSFIEWFSNFIKNSTHDISKILFLVDYEFLNESMTGLDLIEELNITKQSILITSRYEESQIRTRCDRLSIRLIPKSMTGLVPIKFENSF